MKKTNIIAIIVTAVIGCTLGYAAGYFGGSRSVIASYAAKIAAVNKIFPAMPATVFSLSGQVKSINGNTIVINANPLTQNPFAEGNFPAVREVAVTGATSIIRIEQKDPAVFQKEMAASQKAMQSRTVSAGTPPAAITLPNPFIEAVLKLSDVKIGDTITVTAASDITNAARFEATKIQVSQTIPMPTTSAVLPTAPSAK